MTVEAVLLGSAQDGGFPQAGCTCAACRAAWAGTIQAETPTALALVDHDACASWLIDATPAFATQLNRLQTTAPGAPLRGIFLTHAHIGHYTGLIHLGREVMNSDGLPVYATERTCGFLTANAPWSQLVALGNIVLHPVEPGTPVELTPALHVTPIMVPHRAEFSDTAGYIVEGPEHALFYCPDIDGWAQWDEDIAIAVASVDVALLDGTFYSAAELPGRNRAEIPHPLVTESCARLAAQAERVVFVHMNHSNPLLHPSSAERRLVEDAGFTVGATGMRWTL